jgi:hypothetical protein
MLSQRAASLVLEEVASYPCTMGKKHAVIMLVQHNQADVVLSLGQAGAVTDLHRCVLLGILRIRGGCSWTGQCRGQSIATCLIQTTVKRDEATWFFSSLLCRPTLADHSEGKAGHLLGLKLVKVHELVNWCTYPKAVTSSDMIR